MARWPSAGILIRLLRREEKAEKDSIHFSEVDKTRIRTTEAWEAENGKRGCLCFLGALENRSHDNSPKASARYRRSFLCTVTPSFLRAYWYLLQSFLRVAERGAQWEKLPFLLQLNDENMGCLVGWNRPAILHHQKLASLWKQKLTTVRHCQG